MNRHKKIRKRAQLTLAFSIIVFVIMVIAIALIFGCMYFLARFGLLHNLEQARLPLLVFAVVSLIVGTCIATLLSRLPLRPLRDIMAAIDRIADGDYSARISLKMPSELRNLSEKFNHMAEELESVEMLRQDFVNNFSHEFKTPIVSIRGFAKMLEYEELTKQERDEYLDIIVRESERLSELSSNVLNLSKIEKQTILTDKKHFNLSEQIRLAIVLMDSRWSEKPIEFHFDGDEMYYFGNEELLSECWINLLDNAIKFSPDGGRVQINIRREADTLILMIANQGEPIPADIEKHIFDKFYQGDTSHTIRGNGLGLTIAKNIVELHRGEISVTSREHQWIVFEVRLPISEAEP